MDPEQIKKIIENVITDKTKLYPLYIIITIVISIIAVIVVNYVKTKTDNFAMRQDIKALTQKVEEVKSEYDKQLEIFKGGQQIRNLKIKELYDKTITLKALTLTIKNESFTNKFPELFELSKDLLISINSDVIFSKKLFDESKIIENEYNHWVFLVNEAKKRNETRCDLNGDKLSATIDVIQTKILD